MPKIIVLPCYLSKNIPNFKTFFVYIVWDVSQQIVTTDSNDQYLTLFQVGFRKGGIQLFGPLGRRTQLEVVLAGLLLASLLALFGCAITLGVRYNRGNKHTHRWSKM